MTWMIYGANGYTGGLLAERAVAAGERPVLAGRNAKAVGAVARRLDLPFVVVDLADSAGLDAALADVDIVAHCAGPFSATALPMARACLRTGTHYTDVTGEVDVFEALYGLHDAAVAAGVALVPGVGFDVVPTEYLAVRLARELPTATHLDIALVSRGGFSRGTLRTALEGAQAGGRVRADGDLVSVATAHRSRRVRLTGEEVTVHSIPLGDISSAYRSTGIANITDFTRIPFGGFLRRVDPVVRATLRLPGVTKLLDRGIAAAITGPSENTRADTRSEPGRGHRPRRAGEAAEPRGRQHLRFHRRRRPARGADTGRGRIRPRRSAHPEPGPRRGFPRGDSAGGRGRGRDRRADGDRRGAVARRPRFSGIRGSRNRIGNRRPIRALVAVRGNAVVVLQQTRQMQQIPRQIVESGHGVLLVAVVPGERRERRCAAVPAASTRIQIRASATVRPSG